MSIFRHKFVRMQIIPNFVSRIGIWMNKEYVEVEILIKLFIISFTRKVTTMTPKNH